MKSVFSIPIRVYYEDTDAGHVVYYANYLKFMERARTEWLRALGFEQDELSRREGVLFAVRSARLEFLKPARFNDLLQATVRVTRRGKASIAFAQEIRRDALTLCEGEVKVACLDAATFAPRPIPEGIGSKIDAGI
ncbi:MAG: tol-pal system-associated acyl-CoA thioesterase [Candidatus Muproteobacteria bacterium RIFCSPHIGHO2_12_FULL_60_33]|uniref:Tol-pal system-associated acyl-CoA thioesterase n=1 Tax=Candidatus Muproteobacteria bacterium RIFCSPLOWO2_01_FULL_60_18 TaxID=1817768 RepID=A0A1F6TWV1_9PROT|nr:MAG: tol-pal system-associated acyl-CoA thioesterase [Candidatus Muproteobacteria bacterium RIFCSPHIGHO2_01_60_12]OGI49532.1 MAG: tol-pal system-associated acyl-CoA thioesterase [Candidatus Muproteobacteria bacterium RIFCSPLOWO2_01_FULL_60_18]OGI54814.1 MAG: tol-pal system-associated acyl-CoA thioesterase [Candidatus Muproteobacteria bacterium RIFCSPHIGHO2_02_FULL_60_13]OGI55200.1 MAG: tol-pal system-associated acyl-CoA thioesterase [Candidatus Muproteobacteria bacterium RIFCSPHIGHO2_12_FULL_